MIWCHSGAACKFIEMYLTRERKSVSAGKATMAPVRRYLRITKYSVLEIRVYLENPGLVNTWLLRSNEPVLPRIVEAIRPLVLPKLREENERAKTKTKSKSKQAIKDVIEQGQYGIRLRYTLPSRTRGVD